jgi:hypothetical protein
MNYGLGVCSDIHLIRRSFLLMVGSEQHEAHLNTNSDEVRKWDHIPPKAC